MNRKLLVLAFFLLLFLSACQADPFNGQWTLESRVEQVSASECSHSFLGTHERLYLELAQDEAALLGFPILSSGPGAARDTNADWKVLGGTDANKVEFYVWIPDVKIPDGCGDVNLFTGELDGNTIVGTFQGGDCNTYPASDTPSGRVVMEEVTGDPVESCTWSGTFTMTKNESK